MDTYAATASSVGATAGGTSGASPTPRRALDAPHRRCFDSILACSATSRSALLHRAGGEREPGRRAVAPEQGAIRLARIAEVVPRAPHECRGGARLGALAGGSA
eukprot:12342929-Heterocapsa_arctica.AAC.1